MNTALYTFALVTCTVLILAGVMKKNVMPTVPYDNIVWSSGNTSDTTSQLLADVYILSHILHGVIFYWVFHRAMGLDLERAFLVSVGVESAWEIAENSEWVVKKYRDNTASQDYAGDTVLNSVGDIIGMMAGFWFAHATGWQGSVLFGLASEVWTAIKYQDNLTLNVLMLVWPVESIKQWQLKHWNER